MEREAAALGQFDSCTISDALDRLGIAGRVVVGLSALTGRSRVAGRVITVELGPPTPTRSAHLATAAVDAARPGDVIVVAHGGRIDCAGWGGNLSRAARARGVGAAIVDGAARDIDEAVELDFPVFARCATPVTARGRTQEHSWGEPVEIAGVTVATGDAVLADGSGIVFVPAAELDAVLRTAREIAAREAAMARAIDAGQPISTVMGSTYETMLEES